MAVARIPRIALLVRPLPNCTLFSAPAVRQFTTHRGGAQWLVSRTLRAAGFTTVAAVGGYFVYREAVRNQWLPSRPVVFAKGDVPEESHKKIAIQTQREMRFLSFASVEYEGNIYMTPQDFLESITEELPRPRTARRHLHQKEVETYLKSTPSRVKGSSNFFRNLFEKGIFSYTEYLFLLCVLTKPRSGFQIAFNMFDTDGDERVDKKEFLVLEQLMGSSALGGDVTELQHVYRNKLDTSAIKQTDAVGQTSVRFNIWKLLQSRIRTDDAGESEMNNTTLTVHFFGAKGTDVLKYEDFQRFMENLQTEVLELEFNEFSRGMPLITEEEFAKVLLRYTILTKEAHEEYVQRLRKRIPHVQGISFKDFKEFFQFLNNLDDFNLAMRIYTYADRPISEVDFNRAVKACTGQNLNTHLIHVVFQLFDEDGDGRLSHKEFISVMKERLSRGSRSIEQNWLETYRNCIKNEMRNCN